MSNDDRVYVDFTHLREMTDDEVEEAERWSELAVGEYVDDEGYWKSLLAIDEAAE